MSALPKTSEPTPPRRGESGFSIVEVVLSLTLLSTGALTVLLTMTTATEVDESNENRLRALRGALAAMDTVLAYDYGNNAQNFVTHWTTPANQAFDVAGLSPPPGAASPGTIAIDASDPDRILITVTVAWQGRRQAQSLAVPFVMTETVP